VGALALAASEGTVNHARLRALTTEHPFDLSKTLQHLTQAGFLESTGGRGAVYYLPGEPIPTPDDVLVRRPDFRCPAPRIWPKLATLTAV
jgi:ATP-dependent DNA helicase RecG